MLQVENISKQFGGRKALDNVSLDVRKGCIMGLLGPNGAGKTTLIRIVNHILEPDSGTILFKGRKMDVKDVYKIGYMPEERGLYKQMRVDEQVEYLAQLKGLSRSESRYRFGEWVERLGLHDWKNRKVCELSKGMQQKIQFIVTVLHTPDLLILDEPFSGFDPVNARLIKNEILRLRDEGATVILSTHNLMSVDDLCDDIAIIDQSRIVLEGTVSSVKERHGGRSLNDIFIATVSESANGGVKLG